MNLDQLEYFKTVCEVRSITDAADRLFISRPSLSTSLRNLEKELGVTLLSRAKTGVAPTEAGRALYDFALRHSKLYSECMQRIDAIRHQRKLVRFGCTGGIVDAGLVARIYEYEQRTSNLSIEIVNRDYPNFYRAVEHGRLDFALTVCPPPSAHLSSAKVGDLEQYLIVNCANPLAEHDEIDFSRDLRGVTLLETESRFTPYLKLLGSLGIQRKMVGEDRAFIRQLIAHDRGCVLTIEGLLDRYADGASRVRPVVNIPPEIDLNPYLVFRPTIDNQTRDVINYALECLGSPERIGGA